jgi:hypothetical protein
LALGPFLLGLYAVVLAVIRGDPLAAAEAFTRTCSYPFSTLAVTAPPGECHYLCTVAAQGHTWIVRPERLGIRRGCVVVVNRQLAVANAFEDVIHDRWPRIGRALRRAYDALGLPVSRLIRSRAVADVVYLAMKPAEWFFYVALLLVDRGEPEERVARMYAPPKAREPRMAPALPCPM